jgi:hypothetical protein
MRINFEARVTKTISALNAAFQQGGSVDAGWIAPWPTGDRNREPNGTKVAAECCHGMPAPPFPLCPQCQRQMALVRAELQPNLANAVCRHFACECGATDQDIVAERMRFHAPSAMFEAA